MKLQLVCALLMMGVMSIANAEYGGQQPSAFGGANHQGQYSQPNGGGMGNGMNGGMGGGGMGGPMGGGGMGGMGGGEGRRPGPPPEAFFKACKGKKDGDTVAMQNAQGQRFAGKCRLVWMPDAPPEGMQQRPQ